MSTIIEATDVGSASSVTTKVRKPYVALYATSAIFGFLAFISIVGSFLFSYPLGGIGGIGGGLLLDIGGLLMIVVALRLHRGEPKIHRLALGLFAAEFVWSFYKVFIYHETESAMFLVLTVIAGLLLVLPGVRAYVNRDAR